MIPFGSMVENHSISAKDQSRLHEFGNKVLPGILLLLLWFIFCMLLVFSFFFCIFSFFNVFHFFHFCIFSMFSFLHVSAFFFIFFIFSLFLHFFFFFFFLFSFSCSKLVFLASIAARFLFTFLSKKTKILSRLWCTV